MEDSNGGIIRLEQVMNNKMRTDFNIGTYFINLRPARTGCWTWSDVGTHCSRTVCSPLRSATHALDGHIFVPECTIYNRWYWLQEINYFKTPVTENLCSSLALKEERTESVREMLGNKSDEGTERWRKLCNENVYCPPNTAKMTTSGTGW